MDQLIEIADGFWNIRGSFRVAGLLDVGTQSSLVALRGGGFVLLDAYALKGEVEQEVLRRTEQGRAIRAILNLHPFHTAHVEAVAKQFPDARLYGTRRHKTRCPGLRWDALETNDAELHAQLADDLAFTVPRGVDFIPAHEALHFSSVLAVHKASGTLHVDDTLTWLNLPLIGGLKFHPTLRFALQKRAGAVADFRAWTEELVALSENVEHICTAHTRSLPGADRRVVSRVREAIASVSGLLASHERRYA